MFNKRFTSTLQMAVLFVASVVMPSSSAYSYHERKPSKKVVDFVVHINEAGEEYNERIEVDKDKQTELFQVPAHPGADRSDVLNDFKQNLTMLRFPEQKSCYLFPLAKGQSMPEKLLKDLEKASEMVVTETRRADSTWILDGQVTDRSTLSDELAQFCAKYSIYHVKETRDSLSVTRNQAEESQTSRRRRQTRHNINKLCPGGMDLNAAFAAGCYQPKFRCKVQGRTCYKYVICSDVGQDGLPYIDVSPNSPNTMRISAERPCYEDHIYRSIVCCEYIC